MSRLALLFLAALLTALPGGAALAKPGEWVAAIALEGKPALAPDGVLPYVSASGTPGGQLQLGVLGGFDRLNPFMLGGRGPRGMMELVFEPLAMASLNEPMTLYGLLAESMLLASDGRSMSFRLHPDARFSNGEPVTAEDVSRSYAWLTSAEASPFWKHYWHGVTRVVTPDARTVRFEFQSPNPELGFLIAGLPVFRVSRWNADEALVGSGPYPVGAWVRGRMVLYQRNPLYWGFDRLPRRAQFHFDSVVFRYARDASALRQWLNTGQIDLWSLPETERLTDLPSGAQVHTMANTNPNGMLGLFYNLRRPELQDPRVRQALSLLLDFDWLNRQVMGGGKVRSESFFSNTEMAASGRMTGPEQALAQRIFGSLGRVVPQELTTDLTGAVMSPVEARAQAVRLLESAGWVWTRGRLHPASQPSFVLEVALHDHSLAGPLRVWQSALARLGIQSVLLTEDPVAHRRRLMEGRYHLVSQLQLSSTRPGPELRARFSSASASQPGTDAVVGLSDPSVDLAIEAVLSARSMTDRQTAARLLDRMLRSQSLVLGLWHNSAHRVVLRRGLRMPQQPPDIMDPEIWLLTSAWWGQQQ
jgi:ABC-type oligopeptide transport system substrate-binding subunit